MSSSATHAAPPTPEILRGLLRGAWFGVLVGLSVEALLLTLQLMQGLVPDSVRIVADTVQKVSWSSIICAVIAAGQSAARDKLAIAGTFGLIGAPVAFLLARSFHKAMTEVLGGDVVATVTPWFGAGIKGIEYALLGLAIMQLGRRDAGWKSHALAGAAVGGVTYLLVLWLLPASGDALQRAIVEIVHPIGCALAVYMAASFGERLRVDSRE